MRIHTNLDRDQIATLPRKSGAPIRFQTLTEHGSRTHARSFEVRLEGTGGLSNTGRYGAGDYSGATWDEWGAFFGALFAADPGARCGGTSKNPVYGNAQHFHWLTDGRFQARPRADVRSRFQSIEQPVPGYLSSDPARSRTHMPADTHPRHGWIYDGESATGAYRVHHCRRCSAVSRTQDFATFMLDIDNLIGA